MRLEKLEIQGFKSFAKRVEFDFDGKITAVVGPNGSGKSNVVDAVRWVLGEQNARSLRGAKMEDIIFSGSESAKEAGFCEVILTLDNADHQLNMEFDHISIARRMYRSGESEYLINKNRCRLKDIVDLFRDTGIGKEGYSVIGQGRVDNILSGKEEDRRAIFEEAAGVSMYKVRKEDAERKLYRTQENLIRIQDIIHELAWQVEPLERQSEEAKKYLQLHEEVKKLDVMLFVQEYQKADMQRQECVQKKALLHNEKIEKEALLREWMRKIGVYSERLQQIEQEIDATQQEHLHDSIRLEQVDAERKLLEKEQEHLIEQKERCEREKDALFLQQKKSDERQENCIKKMNEIVQCRKEQEDALRMADQQLAEHQEFIHKIEVEISAGHQAIIDETNRSAKQKLEKIQLQNTIQSLDERIQELTQQLIKQEEEIEQRKAEWSAENKKGQQLQEQRTALLNKKIEYDERQKKIYAEIQDMLERREKKQSIIHESELKQRIAFEMKQEHEGFYHSVRRLLQDAKQDVLVGEGVIGVIADLIHVPKGLETAIETALGASIQNIVVRDPDVAKTSIEYLRKKQYGRATFLPLSTIRGRMLNEKERRLLDQVNCVGIASELIQYDTKYQEILNSLLGRTVICEDLSSGIILARKARHSFRIVTKEGDSIMPGGSMAGGSKKKESNELLGRENQIDYWQKRCDEAKQELNELNHVYKLLIQKKEEIQKNIDDWQEKFRLVEMSHTRQKEKLDLLHIFLQKMIDEEESEKQKLVDFKRMRENTIKQTTQDEEERFIWTQREIDEKQAELKKMKNEYQSMAEERNKIIILLAEFTQTHQMQEELQKQASEAQEECQKQLMENNALLLKTEHEWEKNEARKKELVNILSKKRSNMEGAEGEINKIHGKRAKEKERIAWAEQQKKEMQEQGELLIERMHQNDMRMSQIDTSLTVLNNHIWNEYELSYESAKQYDTGDVLQVSQVSQARSILAEKRQCMKQLGNVNLQAMDDYKQCKERYDDMTVQYDDLIKAKEDIETLIARLLIEMKEQFQSEFEKINRHFSRTFVELFGGGEAMLQLSDKENVLQSNIEIIARPPGKKLQRLSLLSGGERAMTAIALLFSMLQCKPTPFCILDEIEAALDEANVNNFANYLKNYANATQFILITHRKGSMAVCDMLYGVAMETLGVSKVISVKLDDAMEDFATEA